MEQTPQSQVDAETRRVIKVILNALESDIQDPVDFNTARKRVIRGIWDLVRLASISGAEVVTELECPECGGVVRHVTHTV